MIVRSSSFVAYKECERKALFAYEMGLVRNGSMPIDLLFGSTVHDAIDLFNKTGDLKDAFTLIDSIPWPAHKTKKPTLAQTFLRMYANKKLTQKYILSERDFSFSLGPHSWIGRWDGLSVQPDGIYVEENKTTNPRFFRYKPNDQLIAYYKGARVRFGDQVKGVIVNDFDVDRVDIVRRIVRFSPEELENWEAETIFKLDQYEASRTYNIWPQRGSACLLYGIDHPCSYTTICESPISGVQAIMERCYVVNKEHKELAW
jgi:hypothetical protein